MNKITIPASILTIEISNICNAKCRWCTTGIQNRAGKMPKANFMTPETFSRGLERLLELKWINEKTTVELFNWGEPFLNPHLDEILHIILSYGLRFYLSTNGSVYRKLPPEVIENMDFLMISLPGMSQESYNRIHQLDAKAVHANMRRFAQDLAEAGASDKLWVNFHVYQFNLNEIEAARKFTEELGGTFIARTAYLNDYRLCQQFLHREMEPSDLYDAASQLFMDFYHVGKTDDQPNYVCPLWAQMCFDERFNMVPCCRLTSNDALGNLFSNMPEQLMKAFENFSECQKCIESGQSAAILNAPMPLWYNNIFYPELKHAEQVKAVLDIRENQLQTVNEAKERAEADLRTTREALDIKEGQLQAVNVAKERAEADLRTTREALDIKEGQLQAVNGAKEQVEEDLRTTREALDIKEGQLQAVNGAKEQVEEVRRTLFNALEIKEGQLQELNDAKERVEAELAEVKSDADRTLALYDQEKEHRVEVENRLEQIQKSASWKITKPLRYFSEKAGKSKQ